MRDNEREVQRRAEGFYGVDTVENASPGPQETVATAPRQREQRLPIKVTLVGINRKGEYQAVIEEHCGCFGILKNTNAAALLADVFLNYKSALDEDERE